MQSLVNAYQEMSISVRKFVDDCVLDSLAPALMNRFAKAEVMFRQFSSDSRSIIYTIRAATGGPAGTSCMFKSGRRFVAEWETFVSGFHAFVGQGVALQLQFLTSLLTSLISQIDEIWGFMRVGSFQSLVPASFVQGLRAEAIGLRKEANQVQRMAVDVRKEFFKEEDFRKRVFDLANGVARIFQRSIPKVVMMTGELMQIRTSLNATCDDLLRVSRATVLFESDVAEARMCIERTSNEFNQVCRALELPLEIRLQRLEDEAAAKQVTDEVDEQLRGQKPDGGLKLDATQGRGPDIQAALADANRTPPR
jgi:hypothetical protein